MCVYVCVCIKRSETIELTTVWELRGSVTFCPASHSLLKLYFRLLFVFQECCLCNLRGGALKTTTDNRYVAHSWVLSCIFL